ncbi:MAG: hypothetical protein PF517_18715 [Salinivirgaceae bacterium]|jgi:hypothetical protein|nr:hypothetical protein [Salinivirgaceae bacterium]
MNNREFPSIFIVLVILSVEIFSQSLNNRYLLPQDTILFKQVSNPISENKIITIDTSEIKITNTTTNDSIIIEIFKKGDNTSLGCTTNFPFIQFIDIQVSIPYIHYLLNKKCCIWIN